MSTVELRNVKFSVLMSVYNKECPEYLEKSLRSVFDQTLLPSEIVLVEDGPLTADLNSVINRVKFEHNGLLKIVKIEKNVGLGMALNEGLKHCKYNLVARMDADDFANKNRFEKQISVLINREDVDVVGSNVCEYDKELENKLNEKNVPEHDSDIKKYLLKRNPLNHMTVIYKKDKVIEAGSYLDCPFFEDYYLWCRMAKNGCKFFNIQDSLVKVRAGQAMVNRRGGLLYAKNSINFEKKILRLKTINIFGFILNSSIRVAVALSPNSLRKAIYSRGLRNGEK